MGSPALGVLLPGFEGSTLPGWLRARLADGLAGVFLFATHIASPAQLRELTAAIRDANPNAVIAVDEEGGDVTRLHQRAGSPYPGNAILGRIDDVELTRRVGATVGGELAAHGITLDFAPDADNNSDDRNPVIGTRSFGADPGLVSRHTAAWIEGLQSTGVAASAKHFPGHGDTSSDSHLAMPVVDLPLETLRGRELLPFAAAVGAGTRSVMTSHILLPQLDGDNVATFSRRLHGELQRGALG
jgi:beta-N-acetylhexosaminidase